MDGTPPHDHHPRSDAAGEPDIVPSRRNVRNTLIALVVLLMAAAIMACAYVAFLIPETPSIEDLRNARTAEPSVLLSADGTQLAVFSQGLQERVALSQISPFVVKALIATEDHRFYEHRGIDLRRTLAAALHTANGDAQGGSTITQQLARNLFPEEIGRARTIERKIKEIITALKIERAYTKDEILETYLNSVPFLYNVVGIEMAARTYYDKPAADLNVLESATLIGMLKGTSYYNPVLNPGRAMKRRNVVLAQMVKRNELADAEFQAMREEPLQVKLNRQPDPLGSAPHFAAYLRKWLVEWADRNDYNLYTDGLIIHSTIDDRLQQAAAQAVERQAGILQDIADVEWGRSDARIASYAPDAYAALRRRVEPFRHFWEERPELLDAFIRETPQYRKAIAAGQSDAAALDKLKSNSRFMARLRAAKTRLEAGFVAIDPADGEVKAWVGSRDFGRDQFDHVAQAERQPGSTFKPFVYGAALELGMRADQTYPDSPVEIRSVDGSIWRPTNMSGMSGRMMSLREGLIYSKNTITAQVMQDVGLPNIIGLARAAGINQSRLDPVPSLSLGTSPVTLLEMASAYSTIAHTGEHREPLTVRRITDRHGKVLAEFRNTGRRAMSEGTALELIDMMRGVVKQGTGQAVKARFGIAADIAGKTGTTQNNTDGWFMLMHPNLVAGAWVGFNDSRVTMRSDYWGQGGHNAALVVGDFFKEALKARLIDVKARFPQPKRPSLMAKAPGKADDRLEPAPDDGAVIVGQGGAQSSGGRQRGEVDDELGRFLSRLERAPLRQSRVESSSGPSGVKGDEAHAPATGRVPTPADINVW